MIPVLHSIDSLLNRFDELSKCHVNLLSAFEKDFSDVENPLRNVARNEDEQRKTAANILFSINENNDQIGSIKTIGDFHRRVIKNRFLHRPPSYSSNDSSVLYRVPSRASSVATDLSSFTQISQSTIKINTPQPVISNSNKNKQNVSSPRRYARSTITAFTKETIDRLSKPKIYHKLPDTKRTQHRSKPTEKVKKEVSKCSTSSVPLPIKRTKTTTTTTTTTTIKPSPKKFKVEHKTPVSVPSRPLLFMAPAPTIHLTFPTPQQSSSRVVIFPKTNPKHKQTWIHLKT